MSKLNTILIGTGGVGAVAAYSLAYNDKSTVSVVVRRDYRKVQAEGFTIESIDYGSIKGWTPPKVYPNVEEAGKSGDIFDYVVLATKNLPDIVKLEDLIEPLVTPEKTTIVLLQNGFDIDLPFIAKYPKNVIISGVSHIGSHNKDGVIYQSQHEKTVISYFENPNVSKEHQLQKTKDFISIYATDKNSVVYFESAKWYRYRKLVYNAAFNTVSALTGVDTERTRYAGGYQTLIIPAMREVVAISKADGIELPSDIVNTISHADDDDDFYKPSMLIDVEKGNPIELEVILGNTLTKAKQLGVSTPILETLYNLLKLKQYVLKENKGIFKVEQTSNENIFYE